MKTVTFDDEAYDLLRSAKLTQDESFSKVVKRVLGHGEAAGRDGWDRSFGAWGDLDDAHLARLRQGSIDAFGWTAPRKGSRDRR